MGLRENTQKFRAQFQPVRGEAYKSSAQQLYEVLAVGTLYGFTPREYFLYQFHRKDKKYKNITRYLSNKDVTRSYRPTLNEAHWVPLLGNKWLFHLHYGSCHIDVTQVYGYFHPQAGMSKDGWPLTTVTELEAYLRYRQPSTLVIKPVGGLTGQAVLVLSQVTYDKTGMRFTTISGQEMTMEELSGHLGIEQTNLIYDGYLLEEKLEPHPVLAEINPYTMNSIRVVTFMDIYNEVDIHFTVLRLGRQGNMTDNWDRGGVSVYIDPLTGIMGQGVFKPQHGGQWVSQHPDTAVTFTNKQIPMWEEIIDLCKRAAKVSPHLRAVGWDVILTPQGPVIIEGNHNWDLLMVQVHGQGYLEPRVRQQLQQYGLKF